MGSSDFGFIGGGGGGSSSGANYVFTQLTPSDSWLVTHDLNKRCSVQVVGSDDKEVIAEITWIDNNTVRVDFNSATTGYVYCN
jgi:hypothetical protein